MSDVDWPVLSAAVMQDIEPALDDAVTVFGKPGTRLVDSVRRKFSLRSENSIRDLTTVLVLADQAGRTDAFLRGADALRRVPFTGNVMLFEPIRQIHCGAHRLCVIEGRPNPFAELREVAEDGRSRSLLKGRSAGSALWTTMDCRTSLVE